MGLDVSPVTAGRLGIPLVIFSPETKINRAPTHRWRLTRSGEAKDAQAKAGAQPAHTDGRRTGPGANRLRPAGAETARRRRPHRARHSHAQRGLAGRRPSPKGTVFPVRPSLAPSPCHPTNARPLPAFPGPGGGGPEQRGSGWGGRMGGEACGSPAPSAPHLKPAARSALATAQVCWAQRSAAGPGGARRSQSTPEPGRPAPPPQAPPHSRPRDRPLSGPRLTTECPAAGGPAAGRRHQRESGRASSFIGAAQRPLQGPRSCLIMSASMRLHSAA